jgi:hypothetical protein
MAEAEEQAAQPPRRRSLWTRIFRSHDFARDITVTTLGVLIALGIGEVVDEIRWKLRLDATERVMRNELGLVHSVYIEKQMLQPCIARWLTELSEIVADARTSGRLPAVRGISAPPNHAGFGDSWTLTLASEVPLHMDPQELMNLATAWVNEDVYAELVDRERDAFDRLSIMENRPGPVPPQLLATLESLLVDAKVASDGSLFVANQDSEVLARNKIPPMFSPGEPLDRKRLAQHLRKRALCHPLQVDGRRYQMRGPLYQPRRHVLD